MSKRSLTMFLIGIFILHINLAYASGALSLDTLIKEAKDNNPDILAAKKRWEASLAKIPQKGKIAMVESQMFAAEYKNKELEVINQVKNAYYDLFMNYKETELKKEGLKLLEGIAKVAEAKYAVGDIMQEEVFKIHSEIAGLNNDIANFEQEKLAKQTRLNTLLNKDPESALGI